MSDETAIDVRPASDLAQRARDILQDANDGVLLEARSLFMNLGNRQSALLVDDARHAVSRAMQDLKRAIEHG